MKGLIEKDLASVRALLLRELSLDGYESIERLGGLTNHTYRVKAKNGREYVVRIPGEGTEQMIVRDDERTSTELACELGIDAELLYFGNKEMPIKFSEVEEPIEKKADLTYPINLAGLISTKVEYQNLSTMETATKNVSAVFELIDQPEYAALSKSGILVINQNAGDLTFVDLKVKVSYKTMYKIVDVRV